MNSGAGATPSELTEGADALGAHRRAGSQSRPSATPTRSAASATDASGHLARLYPRRMMCSMARSWAVGSSWCMGFLSMPGTVSRGPGHPPMRRLFSGGWRAPRRGMRQNQTRGVHRVEGCSIQNNRPRADALLDASPGVVPSRGKPPRRRTGGYPPVRPRGGLPSKGTALRDAPFSIRVVAARAATDPRHA